MSPDVSGLADPNFIWATVKGCGRMLGITDRPNIRVGELSRLTLVAKPNDPRPGYQTWWHLDVINRQRDGIRSGRITTLDARDCTVNLKFVSNERIYEDDGVILIGTGTPPAQRATLYRNQSTYIPIYFEVDTKGAPHPLMGIGLSRGAYVSGAEFMYQYQLLPNWKLDPGDYIVTVTVTHGTKEYPVQFDLTVPQLERGGPNLSPKHSPLRVL